MLRLSAHAVVALLLNGLVRQLRSWNSAVNTGYVGESVFQFLNKAVPEHRYRFVRSRESAAHGSAVFSY
jgi:hypothetical protein